MVSLNFRAASYSISYCLNGLSVYNTLSYHHDDGDDYGDDDEDCEDVVLFIIIYTRSRNNEQSHFLISLFRY